MEPAAWLVVVDLAAWIVLAAFAGYLLRRVRRAERIRRNPRDESRVAPDGAGGTARDPRRMEGELCQLQYAASRVEACPGPVCAFWLDGQCVVGGLRSDLDSNPELVSLLLDVRSQVAGQRSLFRLLHDRPRGHGPGSEAERRKGGP